MAPQLSNGNKGNWLPRAPSSAIRSRAPLSSSSARNRLLFSSMMLSWACGTGGAWHGAAQC